MTFLEICLIPNGSIDLKNLHIESKNNINEYCLVYIIWKMFTRLV